MLHVEWYHVCWPRLTAKRVEPVVSISWASCYLTFTDVLVYFSPCLCVFLILMRTFVVTYHMWHFVSINAPYKRHACEFLFDITITECCLNIWFLFCSSCYYIQSNSLQLLYTSSALQQTRRDRFSTLLHFQHYIISTAGHQPCTVLRLLPCTLITTSCRRAAANYAPAQACKSWHDMRHVRIWKGHQYCMSMLACQYNQPKRSADLDLWPWKWWSVWRGVPLCQF